MGTSAICICALSIYIYLYVKYCVVVIKASMPVVCGVKGVGGTSAIGICELSIYTSARHVCWLDFFGGGEVYLRAYLGTSYYKLTVSNGLSLTTWSSKDVTSSDWQFHMGGISESLSGYFIL